jgi:hypothetical protein
MTLFTPARSKGRSYESVKIYDEDFARAREIRRALNGIPMIEIIGATIEAWEHIPKSAREKILRHRFDRRVAVPA